MKSSKLFSIIKFSFNKKTKRCVFLVVKQNFTVSYTVRLRLNTKLTFVSPTVLRLRRLGCLIERLTKNGLLV